MATSTNYSGRIIDLLIFQGTKPVGEALIEQALGGEDGGYVTTGIQKLVQSFAILFMTERGTIQYAPDVGTGFITAVRQGSILDEADVQAQFETAREFVQQTLDLEADENELPEDEQFDSAELLSFSLNRAESLLTLYVKINSVAGEDRTVYLPVPLAIQ